MLNWISLEDFIRYQRQRTYLETARQYMSSKYITSHGDISSMRQTYPRAIKGCENVLITCLLCKLRITPAILLCFGLVDDDKCNSCLVTGSYLIFLCYVSYSTDFLLGQFSSEPKLFSLFKCIFA